MSATKPEIYSNTRKQKGLHGKHCAHFISDELRYCDEAATVCQGGERYRCDEHDPYAAVDVKRELYLAPKAVQKERMRGDRPWTREEAITWQGDYDTANAMMDVAINLYEEKVKP